MRVESGKQRWTLKWSLVNNETFKVKELPEGKSVIGGKWVYATKLDADGNVKHKARYVAKGYSQ